MPVFIPSSWPVCWSVPCGSGYSERWAHLGLGQWVGCRGPPQLPCGAEEPQTCGRPEVSLLLGVASCEHPGRPQDGAGQVTGQACSGQLGLGALEF